MAYTKTLWKDQNVERPRTYSVTTNQDSTITLQDSFGVATEIGTPVNAENMNHIEQGIYDCYEEIDTKIVATLNAIYPVGSIYISLTNSCPLSSLFGTWEIISEGLTLQQADATHTIGTEIPAGLPNLKGWFQGAGEGSGPCDKILFKRRGSGWQISNTGDADNTYNFNASNYNSIYSDDVNTVQPPALAVNIWRRIA